MHPTAFYFCTCVIGLFVCVFGDFLVIKDDYFFSADSPVLWLRVDPEMSMLRQVTLEQPDFMWQYMLKYERDVVSQSEVNLPAFKRQNVIKM